MVTANNNVVNTSGNTYMPIKLKWVIAKLGITQADLWRCVLKLDGYPLSATAGDGILNWDCWPKTTPKHSIKKQVTDFLIREGEHAEAITEIWDYVGDDYVHRRQPSRVAVQNAKKIDSPFETIEEVEMLTPEAKRHFDLPFSPFHGEPQNRADFFVSADVKRVMAAIAYAVSYPTILAVIGASGSGKTTLFQFERERLENDSDKLRLIVPACINKKEITAMQVIEAIILDLDPQGNVPLRREQRTRRARKLLEDSSAAGNRHMLVFEEAHDIPTAQLKELKRFFELSQKREKLMSILLIGQDELLEKLSLRNNYDAREFIMRCEVEVLHPMDRAQLEQYVAVRLQRAETPIDRIFDKTALDGIMARLIRSRDGKPHSTVYPLMVNILITKALNYCAELSLPQLSAAVIRDL